jgi:hypothetical protein
MKRRKIVVEDITYTWIAYRFDVTVWHPTEGQRTFGADEVEGWIDDGAFTPGRIAALIYKTFLGRSPPPRPVIVTPPPVLHKVLIPKPAAQPEVYLLSREDYEVLRYDGFADRVQKLATTPIAVFIDPLLAKVQANRLNPPNAEMLFKVVDGRPAMNRHGPTIDDDFTLYRASVISMFETTTIMSEHAA